MFSIGTESKRIKYTLISIEIIFIIVGIFTVFKYGNAFLLGSLEKFDNDDVKYIRSAWTLVEHMRLSYENVNESTVFIMPGLTFILGFFVLIFGKLQGIVAFRVFQVFLQAGNLYLIFLIGRKVFNSKVGLIAAVIDVLYITNIFVVNVVLMETCFKFLLLLLIYISIYAVERKSSKLYIVGSIVWVLACMFKPTIAPFPILILIMWIKAKYKLIDMVKYSALVLGIFCVLMSPWWIRNYKDFNSVILFTKSTGNPFLQGTFINYDQSGGWGVPYVPGNNEIEHDENQIKAGLARLEKFGKQAPLSYLYWYTVGKTKEFWKGSFYWVYVFNIPYEWVHNYHLIFVFLGFIGVVLSIKKYKYAGLLLGIILLFNVVYLPYVTFARYAYVVLPFLMIFAAQTLYFIGIKTKGLLSK